MKEIYSMNKSLKFLLHLDMPSLCCEHTSALVLNGDPLTWLEKPFLMSNLGPHPDKSHSFLSGGFFESGFGVGGGEAK